MCNSIYLCLEYVLYVRECTSVRGFTWVRKAHNYKGIYIKMVYMC